MGCGDDDTNASPDASSTTTEEQPAAGDTDAVWPYIQDVLGDWDAAMADALADPSKVIGVADHPAREKMAKAFTDDSPFMRDLDGLLEGYASLDFGYRPNPDGEVQTTTLTGFTHASGNEPDFVSFIFCRYTDAQAYWPSTGLDRDLAVDITYGSGEARRVDGVWELHRLQQLGQEEKPAGTPDPCPSYLEDEGDVTE